MERNVIKEGKLTEEVTPIGYFEHKPTKSFTYVYEHVGWFRRIMIKICFGMVYHEIEKE